jgi:tRNA uridine 5-carboxymethylaminomethyl modification enzyme
VSTSLPYDIQVKLLRTIPGLEQVEIIRPGYAIEYDFVDPVQLHPSLETKIVENLFHAGQINGTSGYEEAAAQGIIAGINAARKTKGLPPVVLGRAEAYIGVLIDDLVTKGAQEPYRMFTSRAEYRLLLREDNADVRLTPVGRQLGLVDDRRFSAFERKCERVASEQARLDRIVVCAARATKADLRLLGADYNRDCKALELLKRPEFGVGDLHALSAVGGGSWRDGLCDEEIEQVELQLEVQAKYAGYIERQEREIARHARQESLVLPPDIDYASVSGLSNEARQKLAASRPITLGQASRLEGVTPSAVSLMLIHLKKRTLLRSV